MLRHKGFFFFPHLKHTSEFWSSFIGTTNQQVAQALTRLSKGVLVGVLIVTRWNE